MIKALAHRGDRPVIILGLENENWRRLTAGQPIHVNGEEVGVPNLEILIIGGQNLETLRAQIEPFMSAETRIHIEDDRH